jgi:hypothetical protein
MFAKIASRLIATASFVALTPLASQADGLRFPFTGSLQGGGRVVMVGTPGYTVDYMTRCGGAPVLETEAAGTTSLLGLVDDFQTHCLGLPVIVNGQVDHLPFFNGRFRFTDTKGRFIDGQYQGKLTPTVASRPPPAAGAPPTGTWIVEGQHLRREPAAAHRGRLRGRPLLPGARRLRPVGGHGHDLYQPDAGREVVTRLRRAQRQTIWPDLCSQRSGIPFASQ